MLRAFPLRGSLPRISPKSLRPELGTLNSVFTHRAPTLSCPTAARNDCLSSRTDSQQEGQIKRKPQRRGRLCLSRAPSPVPKVDKSANTPPHRPSARGGGHLGMPEVGCSWDPAPAPTPRPLLSAAPGLTAMVSRLGGQAPGPRLLARVSGLQVPPAAAGIAAEAARSRGRGEARAGAWELWSPRRAPLSASSGAPTCRTPCRAPGPKPSGSLGQSRQHSGLPPAFRLAPFCFALDFAIIIKRFIACYNKPYEA